MDQLYIHAHTCSKLTKSYAVSCHKHSQDCQGFFRYLPTELFHLILSLLPPEDIASFSLTSSQVNRSLRDYVFTAAGSQHILPTAHPLVTGSIHVLSAMTFADKNEYCPDSSDLTSIKETVKQFESLGMFVLSLGQVYSINNG